MKRVIFSTISGLALLALVPATAQARINVNLDLGIPLYVEPAREYYAPPPPVYYGPGVIYHDRGGGYGRGGRWHDRGGPRGHR
jgi:hypothetical protein